MNWHEQYLGKPWAHNPDPPNSFNCGELLRHIYRVHLGYDAPVLLADTQDIRSCVRDIADMNRYFMEYQTVEIPRDFDIALMSRGGAPDHVGLYCGGNILHCRPQVGVFLDDVFTLLHSGWPKITYIRPTELKPCPA